MAEIPVRFLPHKVDVDSFQGSGAYGDVYANTVQDVQCFRDDETKLVRTDGGEEVTSSTTLYMRLSHADQFAPGSRVHLPTRTATVITAAPRNDEGMFGAWAHLEISLT